MDKFTDLTPEELKERLEGQLSLEESYEEKAKFMASIYRLLVFDRYGEFKDSPEHGNALKEFLQSFFVKKDPEGNVDYDATKEAIREYNDWKVKVMTDYGEELNRPYADLDELRAGKRTPVDYLDTIAKEAFMDVVLTDYMQSDLEEKVGKMEPKEQQYFNSVADKEKEILEKKEYNEADLKDDRRRLDNDNDYQYDKFLKGTILEDEKVINAGKKVAQERKEAAEQKAFEKYQADYEKAEAEVTEYDEPLDDAKRKFDGISAFIWDNVITVMEEAREKLKRLEALADYKSNNSKEFNNMVDRLRDLTTCGPQNSTEEISHNLIELRKAADAYRDRIDGSIFRGVLQNGRDRRDMADELYNFSIESVYNMDKNMPEYVKLDRPLNEQVIAFNDEYTRIRDERRAAIEARIEENNLVTLPKAKNDELVSYPKVQPEGLYREPEAEEVISPIQSSETIIAKPTGNVRNKTDINSLLNEQKEEKKLSPREEALQKREEIMQKRRENEKNGIANDGWEARKK